MTDSYLKPLLSFPLTLPRGVPQKATGAASAFQDQLDGTNPVQKNDVSVNDPKNDARHGSSFTTEREYQSDSKEVHGGRSDDSNADAEHSDRQYVAARSRAGNEEREDQTGETDSALDRALEDENATPNDTIAIGTDSATTVLDVSKTSPEDVPLAKGHSNGVLPIGTVATGPAGDANELTTVDQNMLKGSLHKEMANGSAAAEPTLWAPSLESVSSESAQLDTTSVDSTQDAGAEDVRLDSNRKVAHARDASGESIEPQEAEASTAADRRRKNAPSDVRRMEKNDAAQPNSSAAADRNQLTMMGKGNDRHDLGSIALQRSNTPSADTQSIVDIEESAADQNAVRSDEAHGRPHTATGRSVAHPLAERTFSTMGNTARVDDGGDGARIRIDPARFVGRVARAFRLAEDRGGSLRLRLSPPELGSIRLELAVKQGAVTATIETETTAARRVLLDNLPLLRDRLAEQNIRIEQFDVDVRHDGAGSRYDQATSSDDGHDNASHPESRRGEEITQDVGPADDSVSRTLNIRGDETLNVVA